MNKQAVLHIPDSQYCYAINSKTVEIRLRTSASDTFDKIELIYGAKYDYHLKRKSALLTKKYSDGMFDYYVVRIALDDVRFVYIFQLRQREKIWYFSEDGITDYYDFSVAYYNSFQLPYVNFADIFPTVTWMKNAVFYEIFVDRFCRGNYEKQDDYINLPWGQIPNPKSFAGGDIKGITQKLDYLADMGVTALYLTPIFPSISNHKYDVYDYYDIDKQFGSKEDFLQLVQQAHKRNIKVVLDAVFNHTSKLCQQFQDVLKNGKNSKYFDWFIINGDSVDVNNVNYECFSSCNYMPKWNTSNHQVQKYLIDVALYWIENYDIDGWRLDVGDEVSHEFWRLLRLAIKRKKQDCLILGENWHNAYPYLQGDQYDGIMNYSLTKACVDFFALQQINAKQLAQRLSALFARNSSTVNDMMLNLLDSHDTHRFYSVCNKDKDKLICALSLIFMHTGAPCIYYGTEIPLEGGYDPDCRRTMDWQNACQTEVFSLLKALCQLRFQKHTGSGDISFSSAGKLFILERQFNSKLRLVINGSGQNLSFIPSGKVLISHRYDNKIMKNMSFLIEEVENA